MDSAAFDIEGKKDDTDFNNVVVGQLKRNQKRLLLSLVVLAVLTLFSVAGVIWLAVEVGEDDDDESPSQLTLTTNAASSERGQPLFSGTGYWIAKEALPYPRSDHHVVAVDDYIYIIGGQDSNDTVVRDVTIYDTILGEYSDGPRLPSQLFRFGSAYDNVARKIYIFGGLSSATADATNSVYVLDIDEQEWMPGPDLPSPRSDLCGAFVDGKVYAVGGYSLGFESTLDTVIALDVSSEHWDEVKNMPTPRGDCKATRLDDKLIVIGGFYDETGQWTPNSFSSDVELYSPDTDSWERRASMKHPRGDKAIALLPDNRVLVVGGETHNRGLHTEVATHHVEEYVLSDDVWIDRAPLPYATFRAGSAYVNGMVFVFGGHRTCDAADNEDEESVCTESDLLQVYFDTNHPNVFIV